MHYICPNCEHTEVMPKSSLCEACNNGILEPLPWAHWYSQGRWIVATQNGSQLVDTVLCTPQNKYIPQTGYWIKQNRVNCRAAKLAANAPEMYKALKLANRRLSRDYENNEHTISLITNILERIDNESSDNLQPQE